jgi:hypothetical protein
VRDSPRHDGYAVAPVGSQAGASAGSLTYRSPALATNRGDGIMTDNRIGVVVECGLPFARVTTARVREGPAKSLSPPLVV